MCKNATSCKKLKYCENIFYVQISCYSYTLYLIWYIYMVYGIWYIWYIYMVYIYTIYRWICSVRKAKRAGVLSRLLYEIITASIALKTCDFYIFKLLTYINKYLFSMAMSGNKPISLFFNIGVALSSTCIEL